MPGAVRRSPACRTDQRRRRRRLPRRRHLAVPPACRAAGGAVVSAARSLPGVDRPDSFRRLARRAGHLRHRGDAPMRTGRVAPLDAPVASTSRRWLPAAGAAAASANRLPPTPSSRAATGLPESSRPVSAIRRHAQAGLTYPCAPPRLPGVRVGRPAAAPGRCRSRTLRMRAGAPVNRLGEPAGGRAAGAIAAPTSSCRRARAGRAPAARRRPAGPPARSTSTAIRRDFPILQERVHGQPLVWLDNAATTQKPQAVIDRLSHFYAHENSNIHRARPHAGGARDRRLRGCAREGARASSAPPHRGDRLRARHDRRHQPGRADARASKYLQPGDEIVVIDLEHHANIVPWQMLRRRRARVLASFRSTTTARSCSKSTRSCSARARSSSR